MSNTASTIDSSANAIKSTAGAIGIDWTVILLFVGVLGFGAFAFAWLMTKSLRQTLKDERENCKMLRQMLTESNRAGHDTEKENREEISKLLAKIGMLTQKMAEVAGEHSKCPALISKLENQLREALRDVNMLQAGLNRLGVGKRPE